MSAEMIQDSVRAFQRAGLVGADADDPLTNWFIVEERIELDYPVNVCEGHAQGSGNLFRHGFGDPAVEFLRGVQSR